MNQSCLSNPIQPKNLNNAPFQWLPNVIGEAIGGHIISHLDHPPAFFSNISIDSRTIKPGDLFVALIGDTHDAHNYIPEVVQKGVKGIIIQRNRMHLSCISSIQKECLLFVVDNSTDALGHLAAYRRNHSQAIMIGITGTNGKTTTKEMTASVVGMNYHTLKTKGNHNNHIGVPLTLLQLTSDHQCGVIELGMNHRGEIAYLSKIVQPKVGLITNIGPGHLDGVNNLDGVMHAKGELLDALPNNGMAILNADDPKLPELKKKLKCPYTTFGFSKEAVIRASNVNQTESSVSFMISIPKQTFQVTLQTPGRFMIANALAATAVGYYLGISENHIKQGLEQFVPVHGRLRIIPLQNQRYVIDDSYNANPASMKAAIDTLASLKGRHRGIFVAGDMFELGDHAFQLHKEIGFATAKASIDMIYATGNYAEAVKQGAQDGGLDPKHIIIDHKESICEALTKNCLKGDWILVKGSRAMGMEMVVEKLME